MCDQKTIINGVKQTMTQGVLPFKYEEEKSQTGITALASLPVYLDLAKVIGLSKSIQKHLKIRENSQGWTDPQMVLSLVLLNLAGGDCVEDLKILEADEGFCEILRKSEMQGLKRKVRRALERRWRKEKKRSVPSPSAAFRYLSEFHDTEQEKTRDQTKIKAFIPRPNDHLKGLVQINKDMCAGLNTVNPKKTATLDMDATLIESSKQNARYCYKGFKSYQPLNTWWYEQGVILHTEFRDGNVPAGFEQLRVFKKSLDCLPENVEKIKLRSDTAGYQHDLLKYCETGESERFGRIEFAIGCDVTRSFKIAVAQVPDSEWQPIYKDKNGKRMKTGSEWAEVCFVPNELCHSKNAPEYRYLAKRQLLEEQSPLPGMEDPKLPLPFPTMQMVEKRYKVFGVVTNIGYEEMNGEDLIHWLHERCGKSEEVHAVMKDDLAGGKLPSADFGENAAWWWIMILALNLNVMMKKLALDPSMEATRMKRIRFSIINIPGRIIKRSRNLFLRLSKGHPSYVVLVEARKRIAMLNGVWEPSG
ncbi:transposase, IS4 family [Desulfobacula toluolica Tol2]|uniref:Transposase, IS4 family n=2 Tax=Desulfobacula toluolica TaxID=28223 RepID=K0NJ71_DESTT|nr:transposase, IS4 family [Desulfobacula toluolica Tol2]CCK80895.1 transposase, IS4 family [Desulfobacula toluolica Tol2]CCK80914.1 transposase, IS4 family [Desulfobacula toluolica Tol2]CCK80935.1 transposase, IS4 family [Desulfobacula toluolica Tol2]